MHRLTEIDTDSRTGVCSLCGPVKVYFNGTNPTGSLLWRCSGYSREKARRRKITLTPEQKRRKNYRRRYGIGREEYDRLFDERIRFCQACKATDDLNLDHCHATGKIRGWLCRGCNLALGNARDDPKVLRALAEYVEKHDVGPTGPEVKGGEVS